MRSTTTTIMVSSSKSAIITDRSPKMFSQTYFRKRKRETPADQFASKKPRLEINSDSRTSSSLSSPSLLDTIATHQPQKPQQQEEEEGDLSSIFDLFMQHQDLLKMGLGVDSSVVNDLENFGQVFDDYNHYDYAFTAIGAEDYCYGVKKGVVPSPWDAYATFPQTLCSMTQECLVVSSSFGCRW